MKKWPIIRHIRYFYWCYKLQKHVNMCSKLGIGSYAHENDLLVLKAIWDGEA